MTKKKNIDIEQEENVVNQEIQDQAAENQTEKEVIEEEVDELEKLNAEVKKEKDNFLRLFAEFENYKKRTSRERIELYSTANREVMTALLPILDDFERGLSELEKSEDKALLEGMQLIYNKFKNTLNQKG